MKYNNALDKTESLLRMADIPLVSHKVSPKVSPKGLIDIFDSKKRDDHRGLLNLFHSMPKLCLEKELICVYMCYVLLKCDGDRTKTARILGMDRRNLRYRITKLRKQGYVIPPAYYHKENDNLSPFHLYQKYRFVRFLYQNQCEPYDHISKPYDINHGKGW